MFVVLKNSVINTQLYFDDLKLFIFIIRLLLQRMLYEIYTSILDENVFYAKSKITPQVIIDLGRYLMTL